MIEKLLVEFTNDGETAYISGRCPITKEMYAVKVDAQKYRWWMTGNGYIQDVFPELSVEDREFLLTGLSPAGQEKIFMDN